MHEHLSLLSDRGEAITLAAPRREDRNPIASTVFIRASRPRRSASVPRRVFNGSSIVAGAVSVVFLLWVLLDIGGPRTTDAVDDLGELAAALIAAGACAVAASRVTTNGRRWGWLASSAL